ncbi:MAG: copper amine oxidase N-terminal domain-containing protein [Firmicutes bacterium]|nr:copper amine oxidase N-terminal domain-containing protein [Bacillota bacterium]
MLKKERKNRLSVILAMALLLCLAAQPVWAADRGDYPIFTEYANGWSVGDPVAYGRNVDGQIFVPLRVLAELVMADVDWQAGTRTITVTRCDGAVLQMGIGKSDAQITRLGQTEKMAISAPRLIKGVTYVPLRFTAENLMYQVIWDNAAKSVTVLGYFACREIDGNTYTLDFATGEMTERTADGKVTLLGQAEAADIAQAYQAMDGRICMGWYVRDVRQTDAGNYIVLVDAWVRDSNLTRNIQLLLHNNAQNSRCFYWMEWLNLNTVEYNVYADDHNVWWPEADRVLQIDDTDGEVLAEYLYADMLSGVALQQDSKNSFLFADGEYMLLNCQMEGDSVNCRPVLVNMQTKEAVDMIKVLIPEEQQGAFGLWAFEGGSALLFEKAEDGVLYMTHHYWDGNVQNVLLTYKYK